MTPLSVVVATRDRPQFLEECLSALAAGTDHADELLVVDSCSKQLGTAEAARAHDARLLRHPVPGASRARNAGWRAATNPVVAFVDDDVLVGAGWARALDSVFEDHPEVSFVTGRLGLRPCDSGAERPVAYFDSTEAFAIDREAVDGLGHGANLAVRRSALEAVGGYDESLGPGARWHAGEDLDLIDRLLDAGFTGRYEPAAGAVHVQWRSKTDLLRLEWHYGLGQGARLARLHARDSGRFREISRITWREQGWATLVRCVRERYEFGALSALIRMTATAAGQAGSALVKSGSPDDEGRAAVRQL
ncbi:MAG: glycosyltransferase family 2 protein [Acidimicrobiales bacterium]